MGWPLPIFLTVGNSRGEALYNITVGLSWLVSTIEMADK